MKLAILHYHLNRGGVTRVIQSHLEALEHSLRGGEEMASAGTPRPSAPASRPPGAGDEVLVVLLYGGRREGWPEHFLARLSKLRVRLLAVPLLDYDHVHGQTGPQAADALSGQILQALQRLGCPPEETLLHVHNPSLGKNSAWPACLVRWAEAGYRMLLQIHDFAEDFRPGNYRAILESPWMSSLGKDPGWLYPQAEHLHYAVLNRRDQEVLAYAGIPANRVHLLPNPVLRPGPLPPTGQAKARLEKIFGIPVGQRYLLYPVRAIRRKNLGEALLSSVLAEPAAWISITLAPLNPGERPRYEQWKQWSQRHGLRCVWESGEQGGMPLPDNLAAADALLTTSIAEGFGMVFLESWLSARPLVGRNLPEITQDFERLGVRLPGMWDRVAVPLDWLGKQKVQEKLLETYRQVLAAYQRPLPSDWPEALQEKFANNSVDFGDLDELDQQQVLEKILSEKTSRPSPKTQILDNNPTLASALSLRQETHEDVLRENAQKIQEHFSPLCLGQRLKEIYQRLASAARTGPIEPLPYPDRILERFLDLRRFRMLRT